MKTHGHWVGKKPSPTYNSWQKMKARCLDPNNNMYQYYGARGITFPETWLDFEVFLQDMGVRPVNHSLDRIDNNKPYSKENCRWATNTIQAHNKNLYKKNTVGCSGIYLQKSGKYKTVIRVNGYLKHLGTYPSLQDAIYHRKQAEQVYWNQSTLEYLK